MKAAAITRLYIGFGLAIFLVLVVGVTSYLSFNRQIEESKWVAHTNQVLSQAEYIQKLLVDMETGRRGYRATDEKKFLQPYYESQPKIAGAVEDLCKLVSDNPVQEARAQSLKTYINTIDTFWGHVNVDVVIGLQDKIRRTEQEKVYMDAVRGDINNITSVEKKILVEREARNAAGIQQTIIVLIVGTALVLLVVIMLISILAREFKARVIAQATVEKNLAELEVLNEQANEKNWQLTGVSKVNDSLQDTNDIKDLAKRFLDAVLEYLESPVGAFYFFDDNKRVLRLDAFIGLTGDVKTEYKLDEGMVGHAASKRKVSVIKDIPKGYWKIASNGGGVLPDNIVYVPLWLKNELKGVIEVAFLSKESNRKIELLQAVANNIAIAVNAADAHEKMLILYAQVQEQKEELETQQEELRQTNEELTHQSEVLQASEEELRVQEEELRQINAELKEKNEAIENARKELLAKAEELEVSSKYKSEFLANMSHELRTPLNSILILAKILSDNKNQNLTDKQIEQTKIIHKSGSDLLSLINDILDLSKIEAGKVDMYYEKVPVATIGNDLQELFKVVADERGVLFEVNIGDNVPAQIETDKQRLEQVLKNMLSNALKFTPRNGKVSLQFAAAEKNKVEISVADTGIGIPEEKQKLIFEAFQQADGATNRKYGGTGLGLSISKELAKKLGGEIKLQSTEGQGSTFTLILSVTKNEKIALTSNNQAPSVAIIAGPDIEDDRRDISNEEKVMLIIEDDAAFASVVRDFAREKGYKVVVAGSGDKGLQLAKEIIPSAIILDINLPVLNGREVLKELKANPLTKHIPVHLISADDDAKLLKSADGYTQKPIDINDLEQTFDNLSEKMHQSFKHILILSHESLENDKVLSSISNRRFNLEYVQLNDVTSILPDLEKYDCVIISIGNSIDAGINDLKKIKTQVGDNVPLFAYLHIDIDQQQEIVIKKYADTIIRDSFFARDRLLDELELFLYKLKQTEEVAKPIRSEVIADKTLEGKSVLIADDDIRNVFALTALLEEHGMNILSASDGKEALEVLNTHPKTDIVLMDVMMPEMDGYEAIRQIKAKPNFKRLPVIALTAKAMTGDREKCIEAGASDYITKPLDNDKLLSIMRVWLAW